MNVTVQDLLVTVVSVGALVWLVRRIVGLVAPVRKPSGCEGCASCERGETTATRGRHT